MPVHDRLDTVTAPVDVSAFDNEQFADVITDALLVSTYVPKLLIDKQFTKALTTLLLVVEEYGENYATIFKETWDAFKELDSDEMAAIWEMVKENYDLPEAYDEYELKVEHFARLPILSAGQINDIVKLIKLLVTEIKGKNFFEALGEIFSEFQTLSAEFSDTVIVVREWIALIGELTDKEEGTVKE